MNQARRSIILATLVALIAACNSDGDLPASGPFILPYGLHLDQAISSTLVTVTDTGCAYMPSRNGGALLLAFNPGSTVASGPNRVVLPDGSELVDGETYDLGGGGMDESELSTPEVRSAWEAAVERCRQSGVTDIAPGAVAVAAVLPAGTL